MTSIRRLLAIETEMRERADSALTLARANLGGKEWEAALRGKARGYREAADLLHAELAPAIAKHEQESRAAQ